MLKVFLAVIIIFVFTSCTNSDSNDKKLSAFENGKISVPDGFTAVVVADSVGRSRHIAINNNGDIYVILSKPHYGNGIVAMRDNNGDSKADEIQYFGELTGSGIEIYNGYLYHSTPDAIFRYKLSAGQLLPVGDAELIVDGFLEQNQHEYKPFTFDGKDNMYVNVGAPSNACQEQPRTPGSPGIDPCPQLERQAGIWRFSAHQVNQSQQKDGYRYATGIRNAVAIYWNHTVNNLYVVQHGRDQLDQLWPEYYKNKDNDGLPSEEFLLVKDGSDFGWPYSYHDGFQNKKLLSPEYGGDGQKEKRSERIEDPILAFPAHYAPNDLLFYTGNQFPDEYKNGAFIAFHGSWNRGISGQEGYMVAFVPFDGEKPSGSWRVFADGFKGMEKLEYSGAAKYRPCGLAQGPDGSLYISDSKIGKLWKVMYNGN